MSLRSSAVPLAVAIWLCGCAPIESEVDYVEPAPDAVTSSASLAIEVGFDHAMEPASITASTFIVDGSASGRHTGSFTFIGGDSVVRFESTRTFVPGELVTVRLTDWIRSRSDKELEAYTWSFTIAPPPPPSPFHITALVPGIESVVAPRSGTIQVEMASAFNPFTAGAGSVLVEGSRSGQRTVSFVDLFLSGRTLRLNVERPFIAGERITVAVTPLLHSIEGVEAPASVVAMTVRNQGSLWPAAPLAVGAGLGAGRVLLLDADADGREEWVAVVADGTVRARDVDAGGPSAETTWYLGEALADAAVGDFDADGRADLAVLVAAGDAIELFLGSSSLAQLFDSPQRIALAGSATGATAAHADADGVVDLLLHDPNGVAVAWGSSVAPLSERTLLPPLAPIGAPVAGDFDGDALPDLALPVAGGTVSLLRGLEGRGFAAPIALLPVSPATGVIALSLDGDDLGDLVATAEAGAAPTAFLGAAGLEFSSVPLPIDAAQRGAVCADWDGDGHTDLLSPVAGAAAVRLAAGAGDGRFLAPTDLPASAPVRGIGLGDTNGDGVLDLALGFEDGSWEISLGDAANPPLPDRVTVDDIAAAAGDVEVPFVVRADHETAIEGYTVVLGYDPAILSLDSISSTGTDAGALGAEFEIPSVDAATGAAILAVIIDFLPPFDGAVLPAGSGQSIAAGTLAISPAATGATQLAPTDGLGSPPTDNSFVVGGQSIFPSLVAGIVTIAAGPPSDDPPFVRADANRDGLVDVSDGRFIQNWLQSGGIAPPCLDAADVNDDGLVDLADSIALFDYLFSGGFPPPSPFPLAGSDPTPDSLDCAS